MSAPPVKGVALERRLGLLEATATNVIGMVGVGPFLTIPFMLSAMQGPHILYPWLLGAVLALSDGLVYAHLGAALPGSGGPYVYLREAYRPFGLGGFMGFVFICQVILVAPLTVAGGAVGFADYLQFYWTSMTPAEHHAVAALLCAGVTALLYRDIESVGRLSVIMLVAVVATVGWVIVSGLLSFSLQQAFSFPPEAFRLDGAFARNLGGATLLAIYSYGGYNQVCNFAEEVREPSRTIPRSIILAILVVVCLYVLMSTVIVGMLPWQEAAATRTIASVFIARTFANPETGRWASYVMTGLILFVAASSLYAFLLGYSRIPFAAAREGQFFSAFARLHPKKKFPHVSLLTLGAVSMPLCIFSFGELVSWLMQVQIALVFIWQCAGVLLLHRYRKDVPQPFTMWFYPVPALLSLALWVSVFMAGPREGVGFSLGYAGLSAGLFFVFRRGTRAPQ